MASIFDFFWPKKAPLEIAASAKSDRINLVDAQVVGGSGTKPVYIDKQKPLKIPVLSYSPNRGDSKRYENGMRSLSKIGEANKYWYEQPEYNLAEISRIEDVESFVAQGNIKKTSLMFKNGWQLTGNPEAVAYIKKRFRQMEIISSQSMKSLFKQCGRDLIRMSNAFLIKKRDEEASGGFPRKMPGRTGMLVPVASYFHAPAESMKLSRDDNGNIIGWKQEINGKALFFKEEDVIHFYYNRKAGYWAGTPTIVPVKADIKALRQIEENIELLIDKTLFPIFTLTIGTEKEPPGTTIYGTDELQIAKAAFEGMPTEGGMVLPFRWKLETVGEEGKGLKVEGYVEHFLNRVIAGQGLSKIDFGYGDSANRATADSLSRQSIDMIKDIQADLAEQINIKIIRELLLESKFSDRIFDEDNLVEFQFNEIDIEVKIKKENHGALMYSMHAITEDELRKDYFNRPSIEDREGMYFETVMKPSAFLNAATSGTSSTTGSSSATGKKPPGVSSLAIAKIRQRPSNQHGTKTGPSKSLLDFNIRDSFEDLFEESVSSSGDQIPSTSYIFSELRRKRDLIVDKCKESLRSQFNDSYYAHAKNEKSAFSNRAEILLEDQITLLVGKVFQDTEQYIRLNFSSSEKVKELLSDAIDSLSYRMRFIERTEIQRARIWGKVLGLKDSGVQKVISIPGSNSNDPVKEYDLENLSFELMLQLPPYHPNCSADIEEIKK